MVMNIELQMHVKAVKVINRRKTGKLKFGSSRAISKIKRKFYFAQKQLMGNNIIFGTAIGVKFKHF